MNKLTGQLALKLTIELWESLTTLDGIEKTDRPVHYKRTSYNNINKANDLILGNPHSNCFLCDYYYQSDDPEIPCSTCPLAIAGYQCDSFVPNSPYVKWAFKNNHLKSRKQAKKMVKILKKL
jgi:hypothetical protein